MKHERATLPTPISSASFWHSEPSQFLLGHRTTSELPSSADIVIVGSGITGASIARFLVEDGRANCESIVMLEAREACWGATGRNGGHCQPLLFDRTADVAAFELKNVEAVRTYIEENNVPCEWRTVDGCRSFWTEELMAQAEQDVAILKENAPEIAERVTVIRDRAEMDKCRIGSGCVGATITKDAGSLWPYKLVTFILESLIKSNQLNLQTTTPVTQIRTSSSEESKTKPQYTLETPRGTITTPTLILATNGYTSHLLPSFADLIVPVRGEMSALIPPKNSTILPHSHGMVGALNQPANNDDYLVQRPFHSVPNPSGHLMFGGGRGAGKLPSVGISDDGVVDEDAAAYLRKALLKLLAMDGETEALEELKAAAEWTGIMGYSRDNNPWVGPVPGQKGVWLCGGYTGHGMPNGTLCGKAVAKMVLAEADGEDVAVTQRRMVEEGGIPKTYLITKERIDAARVLPTVAVQDREGVIGSTTQARHAHGVSV
ncbi:FAD dependent oxidoreductase [Delitschia confertaspora ATCC 74209]|uniref:FAD dependent oxidoreductase n=1 Tax=Delitschia confertaspora ATCC 74209 TaxID=1513339 RepID=A0A9P4MWM9_9PLEO|nr:FAD dependent oxidoreductase [Delitschia confertaspora ATCC 74209]